MAARSCDVTGAARSDWLHAAAWTRDLPQATRDFAAAPMRMLVVDDAFAPEQVALLAQWFEAAAYAPNFAVLDPQSVGGVARRGVHVDAERWLAAPPATRFFHFASALPPQSPSPAANAYLDFAILMQSPDWLHRIGTLTATTPTAPTIEIHRFGVGDQIGTHSDARGGRRIGMILYCSRQWEDAWGGLYRVTGFDGSVQAIVPQFNRVVLFDVAGHRSHCVTPVVADRYRYSVNVWFHDPASAPP